MQELKPCPFCGSENQDVDQTYPYIWIECKGCGSTGSQQIALKEAIESWNRRAIVRAAVKIGEVME